MMSKKSKFKRKRNNIRCSLSNRRVEGKEVIIVDYAEDYVKKQGKQIIPKVLAFIFMIPFLLSFVSAQASFLQIDFSTHHNLVFFISFMILGFFLFFTPLYLFGSMIIIFGGFLMLFSEINWIISFFVIIIGFASLFFRRSGK